jgi:hypothetical protein
MFSVAGFTLLLVPELPLRWDVSGRVMLILGCLLLVSVALKPSHSMARVSRNLCLTLLTLIVALGFLEALGRLVGFDFRGQEAATRKLPPFFRSPTVPVPPVFYRRNGPECWTGPVMRTGLESSGAFSAPYQNEPAITVCYDELGFRNEEPLPDWELAIAGDSFVELGFVPFSQLYTTRLSALTGQRVRNLGVSHTGPLTYLRYLELYGLSRSTRKVVIVFYEGNDLIDLGFEDEALRRFEATGQRDFRNVHKQTSFLRAINDLWRDSGKRMRSVPPRINARLTNAAGEVPITLVTRLAPNLTLTPTVEAALQRFLRRYSAFAGEHRVSPWLVYMPCKTRVLDGLFRWEPPSEEASVGVLPVNPPEAVRLLCEREGISFCDLTPGLKMKSQGGEQLLFNMLVDSHLNAVGSQTVAEILARELATGE